MFKSLITALLEEESRDPSALNRFHRNESGMVTWAALIGICFLLVFAGLVFNSGNTINRKMETQNAADSIAYSGSLWVARGMNAVTASNHLIGELSALYVIHHALGGEWLDWKGDDNDQPELEALNEGLDKGYDVLKNLSPPVPAVKPGKVKDPPKSDRNSTVYQAMKQLKMIMAGAYIAHGLGYVTYEIGKATSPWGAALIAIGIAAMLVAAATELKVVQEYYTLVVVERVARELRHIKNVNYGIPRFNKLLYGYQQVAYVGVPVLASAAAEDLSARHGVDGYLRGDIPDEVPSSVLGVVKQAMRIYPTLPIEPEKKLDASLPHGNPQYENHSQLIRATSPWVLHWRKGLREFFHDWCWLSGATDFYKEYTNMYTKQTCVWFRYPTSKYYRSELTVANSGSSTNRGNAKKGLELHLSVVRGLNDADAHKSREIWNQWSDRNKATNKIEAMFVHMGIAHMSPPTVGPPAIFRQANPDGIVALAQSMIYNANPQQKPKASNAAGQPQATVGWDTLNWVANANEYNENADGDQSSAPAIKLNWQAKLSPVTTQKLVRVYATMLETKVEATLLQSFVALVLMNH